MGRGRKRKWFLDGMKRRKMCSEMKKETGMSGAESVKKSARSNLFHANLPSLVDYSIIKKYLALKNKNNVHSTSIHIGTAYIMLLGVNH
jgi:hypothetical protein